MEKEEIIPMEVVDGAGENKPADSGVSEETLAVVVADEQEVTVVADGGAKRQRGRPRKELMGTIELSPPSQKRGRGRPKGSGKLQRLQAMAASLGDGVSGGSNFTPHLMRVQTGENIVERIRAFSEATRDSVCIISGCGSVSIADLYTSAPRSGILRYEGELNIVTLNGSHTYTKQWGGAKLCLMSVQLAHPDGRLCGGAVAGSLIASTPTQIMMGTFKQNWKKARPKYKSDVTIAAVGGSPVQHERGGEGGGMRLLAIAERVDDGVNSDQLALAHPIGWNSSASAAI